ncbi:hypothetical protein K504DRAFT_465554 [Pleomassaria siparia CBS 279.74]|uniref:Uncharacterized protein n=1 Tax=Pleomassaria siparia CBS 279.74 TaxID=1314801 RepID=A0A6G1KFY2_9PLEO|nr:hypothetical protein K504DRAFT_465554 [Pleomassaria siparia CBS 279.74]
MQENKHVGVGQKMAHETPQTVAFVFVFVFVKNVRAVFSGIQRMNEEKGTCKKCSLSFVRMKTKKVHACMHACM